MTKAIHGRKHLIRDLLYSFMSNMLSQGKHGGLHGAGAVADSDILVCKLKGQGGKMERD